MKTPTRKPAFSMMLLRVEQALGAQTEHQPAALTALPGNIWQGRQSPSPAWISAQLAQFCSAAGLLRVDGSTAEASFVYFMALAIGSSSDRCGRSEAMASRPGCTKQPAAATADSWRNLRRAMLLNVVSLVHISDKFEARMLPKFPERPHNESN